LTRPSLPVRMLSQAPRAAAIPAVRRAVAAGIPSTNAMRPLPPLSTPPVDDKTLVKTLAAIQKAAGDGRKKKAAADEKAKRARGVFPPSPRGGGGKKGPSPPGRV
jgi:hypothetical protein